MKIIVATLGLGILSGIGMAAGYWLWENVLEEKVSNLKDRRTTRNSEESWA